MANVEEKSEGGNEDTLKRELRRGRGVWAGVGGGGD